jgi:hypothetical protein
VAYRRGEAAPDERAFDLAFFPRNQRYTVRLAATPASLDAFDPLHVEYLAIDRDCFEDETAYHQRQALAVTTSYRHPTRRRYLANYVPRVGDEVVPFSELAERCGRADQQGDVEPLLGIVKMDVDQLGLLVAEGLGKATSISRVATFSRMVDLSSVAGSTPSCGVSMRRRSRTGGGTLPTKRRPILFATSIRSTPAVMTCCW